MRTEADIDKGPVKAPRGLTNHVCVLCPFVGEEGYDVDGSKCTGAGIKLCSELLGRGYMVRDEPSSRGDLLAKDKGAFGWHRLGSRSKRRCS